MTLAPVPTPVLTKMLNSNSCLTPVEKLKNPQKIIYHVSMSLSG